MEADRCLSFYDPGKQQRQILEHGIDGLAAVNLVELGQASHPDHAQAARGIFVPALQRGYNGRDEGFFEQYFNFQAFVVNGQGQQSGIQFPLLQHAFALHTDST